MPVKMSTAAIRNVSVCCLLASTFSCADADRGRVRLEERAADSVKGHPISENGVRIASDAQFFFALRNANLDEIQAGTTAADKALSGEVKAFARETVSARTTMSSHAAELQDAMAMRALRALGAKRSTAVKKDSMDQAGILTVDSAASNPLSADSAPKGRDVDRVYLDGVIRRSRAMLKMMASAMGGVQTTDVRYFIQQNAPIVLRELDNAQSLRRTIQ